MAVAYKSAGTGAGTETTGVALNLGYPATVDANDILIAHVIYLTLAALPVTPAGWTQLYGPADLGTGTATGRAWVYGKLAVGNEGGTTVSFGTNGGTAGRFGRIYSFSGYMAGVIGDVAEAISFSDIPSEQNPPAPDVTTTIAGGMAVGLVCQDDNNTVAVWTGATGGTWDRPVGQFTSTAIGAAGCMCALNVATPTSDPGTISGGSTSTPADEGSTIGFEIRPQATVAAGAVTLTPPTEGLKLAAVAVSPNPTSQVTLTPAVAKILPGVTAMWGAGAVDDSATIYNVDVTAAITNHVIDMPDTIAPTNMLILVAVLRASGVTATISGWTKIVDNPAGSTRLIVAYRISDGSEGSTVTLVSSIAATVGARVYRVPGWQLTNPPEATTPASGSSNLPDPPNLDPSAWATDITLWFAIAELVGPTTTSVYPLPDNQWTLAPGSTSRATIALCTTIATTSQLDPSTFTMGAAGTWQSVTLGLHIAVPAVPGQAAMSPAILRLQAPFIGNFPGAVTLTPATLRLRGNVLGLNGVWTIPDSIDNTASTNVSAELSDWLANEGIAGDTFKMRPGSYWIPQGLRIARNQTVDLAGAVLFTDLTLGPEDPDLAQSQIDYPPLWDDWAGSDTVSWPNKRCTVRIVASNVNLLSSVPGARIQGAARKVLYRGGFTTIPEGCEFNSPFEGQHGIRIGYNDGAFQSRSNIDIDLTNISIEFCSGDGIYIFGNIHDVDIHGAQAGRSVVDANSVFISGDVSLGANGGLPNGIDVGGGGGGAYDLWIPGPTAYPGIHHTARQGIGFTFGPTTNITIRDLSMWRIGRSAIDVELGTGATVDGLTIARVEFGHWYLGHINNPYDGPASNVLIEDCVSYKGFHVVVATGSPTAARRSNWTIRRNRMHHRVDVIVIEATKIDGFTVTDNQGLVQTVGEGIEVGDSTSVTISPAEDIQFPATAALVDTFIDGTAALRIRPGVVAGGVPPPPPPTRRLISTRSSLQLV